MASRSERRLRFRMCQRQFDAQLRTAILLRFNQQPTAGHFYALAHSRQAIAFGAHATDTVVADFKHRADFAAFKPSMATARVGVANDVGDRFTLAHREHVFGLRRQFLRQHLIVEMHLR